MGQFFVVELKDKCIKPTAFYAKGMEDFMRQHNGFNFIIEFYRQDEQRSNQQNRFYWGPFLDSVIDCFRDLGRNICHSKEHKEAIHESLKNAFGLEFCHEVEHFNILTGEVRMEKKLSTTKMSTQGFSKYLEEISRFFAENYGWVLPIPDETKRT